MYDCEQNYTLFCTRLGLHSGLRLQNDDECSSFFICLLCLWSILAERFLSFYEVWSVLVLVCFWVNSVDSTPPSQPSQVHRVKKKRNWDLS